MRKQTRKDMRTRNNTYIRKKRDEGIPKGVCLVKRKKKKKNQGAPGLEHSQSQIK